MKTGTLLHSLALAIVIGGSAVAQQQLPGIEVTRFDDQLTKLWVAGYVNVVVLRCADTIVLFDSGFEETASQVAAQLDQLGVARIDFLINTHADRDHTGGNALLGAESMIISHENCWRALAEQEGFPATGLPTVTFSDSLRLSCGSDRIELIAMPGGHTNGDIIIRLPRSGIVYLGDIIVPETFPVVWLEYGDDVGVVALARVLEDIIGLFPGDTRFLSAHGRDYTMEDLKQYHAMVVRTVDLVRRAMETGKTTQDMKQEGLLQEWRSWNSRLYDWVNTDYWIDTIYQSLANDE
jgi:glyoxylase-like metal-dependent hydrolase (beta-lactamase superfamily II)